jgi:ATP-binding cassette subfamily B protein
VSADASAGGREQLPASDLAVYRRVLRFARGYWPHLGASLALSLLAAPLALLAPLPLKLVVDSVLGRQPLPGWLRAVLPGDGPAAAGGLLAVAAGVMLAVTVLRYAHALANWLLQTYTGERLTLALRASLFRHVQRLSLAFHDAQGTADTLYRIEHDAPSIRYVTIDGLIPFVTAAATLVGMAAVMARLDWQVAAIALGIAPLMGVFARVGQRRLRLEWYAVKDEESRAMSVVQEVLGAVRVVLAFGQEDREHERFVRHSARSMRGQMRVTLIQGGFDLAVGVLIALGTAAALVVGVRHVWDGRLTLGDLLVVMTYLAQLYAPVETISKKVTVLQSSLASADRVLSLLDRVPDVVERPHARPIARARGAVEFRDVSFGYEPGRPVLERVSFAVAPGTRVGIVGTTGVGKTTLVGLLTRFYDVTAGAVLLDGEDVRDYRLADLRNQFGIVLQEPVLFARSIAENIAYARPGASEQDIVAAARAAGAHEFIERLPEGYATPVGERGVRLSGGERQRVSIARAFLRDAPVLVLDEPTSAVDTATESGIMEAMTRLMHGRTTFMIAHRLSTLGACDVCLRLERGRPPELVPRPGPGDARAAAVG